MLVDEKVVGTSQEASKIFIYFILKSLDENVVSLFHWALFVLNFDFVSKKIAPANTGNIISSMKRSRDFRIKYINIFLSSWEVTSLLPCFFVYEHAHLTADYRGRDLASLRHRRVGKANSHGYLLLSVWSGKIDKRSFLSRSMFCDERPRIDHNCRSLGTSDVHLDRS